MTEGGGQVILARISHYWPPLGGTNCSRFVNGRCVSRMASGQRWQDWANGQDGVYALACPKKYAFGTVFVLPGGEVFQCWDRGGAIKGNWLDLMVKTAPVPYGSTIAVTVYETLGPHNKPIAMAYPYEDFWFTQGIHGGSYGHKAIDIKAGQGAALRAPIAGKVLNNGHNMSNTELVIDGERYMVTMWHGNYTPATGSYVQLGDPVGTEGNNGYVKDGYGRPCNGRAGCGYHTHINVFDKHTGTNVNPTDVLVKWSN